LGNIVLNDTLNSNEDDEHLVDGQVQGGVEDDDVLVIPTERRIMFLLMCFMKEIKLMKILLIFILM